jgi:hypothetical protein
MPVKAAADQLAVGQAHVQPRHGGFARQAVAQGGRVALRHVDPTHALAARLALVHGDFSRTHRAAAVKIHGWVRLSWI